MKHQKALSIISAIGLSLIIAGSVLGQDATPPATTQIFKYNLDDLSTLPAEFFTRLPSAKSTRVSPDGKHVAWIEDDVLNIFDIDTGEVHKLNSGEQQLDKVVWVGNEYLIVWIYNEFEDHNSDKNMDQFIAPLVIDSKAHYLGALFGKDMTSIVHHPGAVIRVIDGNEPELFFQYINGIYKLNLKTRKEVLVSRESLSYYRTSYDSTGWDENVNFRLKISTRVKEVNYDSSVYNIEVRKTPKSKWETFPFIEEEGVSYSDFDYANDDNSVYWVAYDKKSNTSKVFKRSLDTGVTELYDSAEGKGVSAIFDTKGLKVIGISSNTDRTRYKWHDDFYAKTHAILDKAFLGQDVSIINLSSDRSKMILYVTSASQPPIYYLYDAKSHQADIVAEEYPELAGVKFPEMEYFTYKARDGLEIPAYVTKPINITKEAPLVVFVHGGPHSRDQYSFDWWTQFMASRGYVVLQPQFRGSKGFGDKFQRAGDGEWGAKMNTDLIDGVDYLAAQGVIDPKRVCIVGWSYGGYAAQTALALTPDRWACGVSGAGISDIAQLLLDEDAYDDYAPWREYFRNTIADALYQGDLIRQISPIKHIDAIKAPLLLIHGDRDYTVLKEHSIRMNEAMKRGGKVSKLVMLPLENHDIHYVSNRNIVLKEIEVWLNTYLKPKPQ